MSNNYESPAVQRWAQQRAQDAADAEARRQPRADWTDLTHEQFLELSGAERNRLYRADRDKYQSLRDQAAPDAGVGGEA